MFGGDGETELCLMMSFQIEIKVTLIFCVGKLLKGKVGALVDEMAHVYKNKPGNVQETLHQYSRTKKATEVISGIERGTKTLATSVWIKSLALEIL